MDPAIFRKGDAPSVLVVNKSWDDIINKPDFFDELAKRIVKMSSNADAIGLMQKSTPFGGLDPEDPSKLLPTSLKGAINSILMEPLLEEFSHEGGSPERQNGSILADAFWDEIAITDDVWKNLRMAIAKAYGMKEKIEEGSPLTSASTMQDTKDTLNDTVIKPLLGIDEDE